MQACKKLVLYTPMFTGKPSPLFPEGAEDWAPSLHLDAKISSAKSGSSERHIRRLDRHVKAKDIKSEENLSGNTVSNYIKAYAYLKSACIIDNQCC